MIGPESGLTLLQTRGSPRLTKHTGLAQSLHRLAPVSPVRRVNNHRAASPMSTMFRSASRRPVVLVPACSRMIGPHPFHIAGRKYLDAIRLVGCLPLILPPSAKEDVDDLLCMADGLLLPGSPSNVHPCHFGEDVHNPELPLDPARDGLTLPLIRAALDRGTPLMAICRGLQEVNVALGGSLHQAVHLLPGMRDHREDKDQPAEVQYGLAHTVSVQSDGILAQILGPGDISVNSLHGQGIKRLAPGLRAEAVASDGLIEAFSHPQVPGFNLSVQWHPEWLAAQNPISLKLFTAFGHACQSFKDRHRPPSPES